VFDTAPRSDGTCLLLTAGASEQVPFEIAMCVSSSMPRPERETLALCLMRLARRAQRETWGLDSPREVRLEGLPPPLAGVVLLVPEGEAWTSLTSRLPRSPELLVAVGVMESVLQRGAHAIEPELREGGYRTDPRTASGAER